MSFDFDRITDRSATNSIKWKLYGPDMLPLWVADMDFPAPEPVRDALRSAVEHGIFGYEMPSRKLAETVAARMERLYGWKISPEAVLATPGVVAGFTAAARAVCAPGEGVLVQPPVYPPFLTVQKNNALLLQEAQLEYVEQGSILHYEIDWERLESAVNSGGARTGMFLLCNPHNPTGQVFLKDELMRIANICARNDMFLCSDEIHSELLLGGSQHVPAASLDSETAARSITLIAPSKTFNIPGLFCGFAIITDETLRMRFKQVLEGMALHVNSLGLLAAQVAFSGECDDWLDALRAYLTANRDFLVSTLQCEFPGLKTTIPDATYLAWLDCREYIKSGRIEGSPHKFFLHKARVVLNEGAEFGHGGEGFVRLNFGCPRQILQAALERMKTALA
jgi:cystathionine beta-lyase